MKLWILTLGKCVSWCETAGFTQDVALGYRRCYIPEKGKPPPESKSKIDRCNLHMHVETKVGCKNTILFTDGAPAYPSVVERLQIQHEWVNHSKGQFTKTVTRQARERPIVVAHTGTIDSCWKQCKKMIPSSLSSRHPMLLTYCKAWQWRFVHRNDNVAQITAKTLQKQMWWKKTCRLPAFPLGSAKNRRFATTRASFSVFTPLKISHGFGWSWQDEMHLSLW